jgi:hypothetical protein
MGRRYHLIPVGFIAFDVSKLLPLREGLRDLPALRATEILSVNGSLQLRATVAIYF